MARAFSRYARWLHLRWPAGTVEALPQIGPGGATRVPGLYVVGDLTGIPLLKFAAESGARAVRAIAEDRAFVREQRSRVPGVHPIAIVGAGVSGMAAALEARRLGLDSVVFESARAFQTIADFPPAKPIYAYPLHLPTESPLQIEAEIKEELLTDLERQARGVPIEVARVEGVERRGEGFDLKLADGSIRRASRVILALGRSGDFRRLDVPGEDLDLVHHRLHDPRDFAGRRVLVVGGGDSAVETALALAQAGAAVSLSHRSAMLSRPKPDNLHRLGATSTNPPPPGVLGEGWHKGHIQVRPDSRVTSIHPDHVRIEGPTGRSEMLAVDVVFVMIGREAPLSLLRQAGVRIAGDWSWRRRLALVTFLLACVALYDWKSGGWLDGLARQHGLFPYSLLTSGPARPARSLIEIVRISAAAPAFWYTLAYSLVVTVFGWRRIRRRRTPYVRAQTLTLMAIQVGPLFLLPELLLPWLDARGWLSPALADALFPQVDYGHGREYWRAYGLILAWPLNVYNVFTPTPLWAWLVICFVQTAVLIPAAIYFWGKGAYCGWICSCGALAETLGDTERHKMPHGPRWNRLNLAGQVLLLIAVILLMMRVTSWVLPESSFGRWSDLALSGSLFSWKWTVDVFLAGVIGYGLYFWFSGRVWCRFFCPLAALMHIYARWSRFRILSIKQRCISCNVCTSVCHQGIDVMNFANKGDPLDDPECVRCSACVAACPTAVLSFGQVGAGGQVIRRDRLTASLVALGDSTEVKNRSAPA